MVRLSINFPDTESASNRQVQPADALTVNQAALTIAAADGFEFLAVHGVAHGSLPEPIGSSLLSLVELLRQGTVATLDAISGDLAEDEAIARTEEIVRQIATGTANLEQAAALHRGDSASH